MRYGLNVCTLGEYADPRLVVDVAAAAEEAGWESLFVWDHLGFAWGVPSGDPWITLSAVAQATSRLRIGTGVTPLARRRPQVVANTVACLDRLSGGRVVLGAGLGGVPVEFTAFGESDDPTQRAERLDEALELVTALWSGERVYHQGRHYTVAGVTLAPLPVQRPRVPIWIGGDSAAAKRRAVRWDGWIVGGDSPDGTMVISPDHDRTALRLPSAVYRLAMITLCRSATPRPELPGGSNRSMGSEARRVKCWTGSGLAHPCCVDIVPPAGESRAH